MPEAVLSPQEWEAVKAASIKGVPDAQLAEAFGINGNAIRQRRFLDPVWKAAVAATREKEADNKAVLTQSLTKAPETAEIAQKVASTVSENIARLGEQNRLLALQIAGKGLKQANDAPPEVQSWQDVKALMDIVSKAAGLDQGNAVQVNILNDSACSVEHGEFPVFEAE